MPESERKITRTSGKFIPWILESFAMSLVVYVYQFPDPVENKPEIENGLASPHEDDSDNYSAYEDVKPILPSVPCSKNTNEAEEEEVIPKAIVAAAYSSPPTPESDEDRKSRPSSPVMACRSSDESDPKLTLTSVVLVSKMSRDQLDAMGVEFPEFEDRRSHDDVNDSNEGYYQHVC